LKEPAKMGFNATWSMAGGGMVGGGIFSVLGIVLITAGGGAWLSFVIAGLIALATGHSYIALASRYGEGGGAFTFLRKIHREGFAGGLSWILLVGYVLTISVYAFTFGHYLGTLLPGGAWVDRLTSAAIVLILMGVNLAGVGQASWVEVITVWGKLAVLFGLAAAGLWHFSPGKMHYPAAQPGGLTGALVGAAVIFMAYEGFQLLTYDYDDIREPDRTLPKAVISAILSVMVLYVLVTLGAVNLVGAGKLIQSKEIALAEAGRAVLGSAGMVIVSMAAAFSTASAINATLFATARLANTVAADGELPYFFRRKNSRGIPDRAVVFLGLTGASLAMASNLEDLVEAASLAFLFTFAVVNILAALETGHNRWVSWAGAAGACLAGTVLLIRIALKQPLVLGILAVMVFVVIGLRPIILKRLMHR
jgi:amino acid transporter